MSSSSAPTADTCAHAVAVVAVALERLAARIARDLDVDAGEGVPPDDPEWAETIAAVAAYSRECVSALDEPEVFAVLSRA